MDNCMRIYAAFIIADRDTVVDCIIHGKKMTDIYLEKRMTFFNAFFPDVYDKASEYVSTNIIFRITRIHTLSDQGYQCHLLVFID